MAMDPKFLSAKTMTWSEFVLSKQDKSDKLITLGKGDLFDFLTTVWGQDKRWVTNFLNPLDSKWQGTFYTYSGKTGYQGPANEKNDPPAAAKIILTVEEVGDGKIKNGIFDYTFSGTQQEDGNYKGCTKDFVEKHVLEESAFKDAQKQGKQRIATQKNVPANSVISDKDVRNLQIEVTQNQKLYAAKYKEEEDNAIATGSVVRGVTFTSQSSFEVETYDPKDGSVTIQSGKLLYSVIKLKDKYLINHFAGVA